MHSCTYTDTQFPPPFLSQDPPKAPAAQSTTISEPDSEEVLSWWCQHTWPGTPYTSPYGRALGEQAAVCIIPPVNSDSSVPMRPIQSPKERGCGHKATQAKLQFVNSKQQLMNAILQILAPIAID